MKKAAGVYDSLSSSSFTLYLLHQFNHTRAMGLGGKTLLSAVPLRLSLLSGLTYGKLLGPGHMGVIEAHSLQGVEVVQHLGRGWLAQEELWLGS